MRIVAQTLARWVRDLCSKQPRDCMVAGLLGAEDPERFLAGAEVPDPSGVDRLRFLTLNVWGLPHTPMLEVRVAQIAEIIANGHWDVIALQEAWFWQERELLKSAGRRSGLRFSHQFAPGIGLPIWPKQNGCGLLVLSRYPIVEVAYNQYHVNGRPYRFDHMDCMAAKGVGLFRIAKPGLAEPIDLYVTHLISCYSPLGMTGAKCDLYRSDRIFQAYQLSKFIRATRRSELVILAGDFNAGPETLCVRIPEVLVGMADAYQSAAIRGFDTNVAVEKLAKRGLQSRKAAPPNSGGAASGATTAGATDSAAAQPSPLRPSRSEPVLRLDEPSPPPSRIRLASDDGKGEERPLDLRSGSSSAGGGGDGVGVGCSGANGSDPAGPLVACDAAECGAQVAAGEKNQWDVAAALAETLEEDRSHPFNDGKTFGSAENVFSASRKMAAQRIDHVLFQSRSDDGEWQVRKASVVKYFLVDPRTGEYPVVPHPHTGDAALVAVSDHSGISVDFEFRRAGAPESSSPLTPTASPRRTRTSSFPRELDLERRAVVLREAKAMIGLGMKDARERQVIHLLQVLVGLVVLVLLWQGFLLPYENDLFSRLTATTVHVCREAAAAESASIWASVACAFASWAGWPLLGKVALFVGFPYVTIEFLLCTFVVSAEVLNLKEISVQMEYEERMARAHIEAARGAPQNGAS